MIGKYCFKVPCTAAVLFMSVLISNCSGSDNNNLPPMSAPSVYPPHETADVETNSSISITFSSTIDPSTVNNSTIQIANDGGIAVPGTFSFTEGSSSSEESSDGTGTTVTFTPSQSMSYETQHTVTVTTGVKNTNGQSLGSDSTTTFYTKTSSTTVADVNQDGTRLAAVINSFDVEDYWAKGQYVDWETGATVSEKISPWATDHKTHCSGFAGAVCAKLNIPLLHAPFPSGSSITSIYENTYGASFSGLSAESDSLLATKQGKWLASHAQATIPSMPSTTPGAGNWCRVSCYQAQSYANQGYIAVVVYESTDSSTPGHIAVIAPQQTGKTIGDYPGKSTAYTSLAVDGPYEAQSGGFNSSYTTVSRGFAPPTGSSQQWFGAGSKKNKVKFYVYNMSTQDAMSYYVPVVTTQFSGTDTDKYHVYVSNGGGAAHPMVLDTGSQLMVVPVQYVGSGAQAVTPTVCHSIGYGDGTTWCGRFYEGQAVIGVPQNYTAGQGGPYPTTQSTFQFLVADPNDTYCISQCGNCNMPADLTNRGVMGVGFGQGTYGEDYNALLNLQEVATDNMQPGYIIQLGNATPGFTIGLTATNKLGFSFIQLGESSLYPGQWDPNSFTGTVTLASGGTTVFNQTANMLFDTGTTDFTLKTPTANKPTSIISGPHDIDAGITVSVSVPGSSPIASYSYTTTTDSSWSTNQTSMYWKDREDGVYFLIGQYIFLNYDYLFDPTTGRIGFKALEP